MQQVGVEEYLVYILDLVGAPPSAKIGVTMDGFRDFVVGARRSVFTFAHYEEGNYESFYRHLIQVNPNLVWATSTLLVWRRVTYGKSPYVFLFDDEGNFDFGCRTPFFDDLRFGMSGKEFDSVMKKHMTLSCYDNSSIFYLGYVQPVEFKTGFDFDDFYVMEKGKVLELPEGCEWFRGTENRYQNQRTVSENVVEDIFNSSQLRQIPWHDIKLTSLYDWLELEEDHYQNIVIYKIFLDENFMSVTDDGNPKYVLQNIYTHKQYSGESWKLPEPKLFAFKKKRLISI
jgi:hypothetical protein